MKKLRRIIAALSCAVLMTLPLVTVHSEETKEEAGYLEYLETRVLYSGRAHRWTDERYQNTVIYEEAPNGELYADYEVTDHSLHVSIWTANGWVLLEDGDTKYKHGWVSGTVSWDVPPKHISLWQKDIAALEWDEIKNTFTADYQNLFYDWRFGENTDEKVYRHGYYSLETYCYVSCDKISEGEPIEYVDLSRSDYYTYLSGFDKGPESTLREQNDFYTPNVPMDHQQVVFYVMVEAGGTGYGAVVEYEVAYIYEYHRNESPVPASAEDNNETDPDQITQTENTDALSNPGEDSGVGIITEIIEGWNTNTDMASALALSMAGALAAAGALGAAAGGNRKNDRRKDDKKKKYKMYVSKSFGDAIQKGGQPVRVYARIAQIIDGKERDCPELTEQITASGEGLSVRTAGIEGRYMSAEVTAAPDEKAEKGTLTFALSGKGGTMQRNVFFRLVGDPRIVFPGETGDGHWDMNVSNDIVQMIAGEAGRERLRFVIRDAVEEPETIRFLDTEGFAIDYERDPKLAYTYYALIDNQTERMDKESDIFADKEDRKITVEAVFRNGLRIRNDFTIELYPDGLSVSVPKERRKDGFLTAATLQEERGGIWNGALTIPACTFHVYVCYPDKDGHAVIHKNPSISHEDPDDEGKYGCLISENFRYHVTHMSSAGIDFCPEVTLPVMADPYYVTMELSCRIDGEYFEGDLPLALTGDMPKPPSKAKWETALQGLKKSVRYFGVDNDEKVRQILRHADEHSAAELENARIHVIAAAVKFYEEYGEAYQKMDALYTDYIVISGSLVKAGDYAVKVILVRGLGKTMGTTAEHIINPFKNMLFNYIGECIAEDDVSREEMEKRFFQTLMKGVQDAICETITGDLKSAPENMGYAVSAYLMVSFSKHYWGYGTESAKGDVYKAVIAACGDLALDKFKAWLSEVLSGCSKKVMNKIAEWSGSMFQKAFSGAVQKTIEAAGDKAFIGGMTPLVKSGSVSTAGYLAVKASKDAAQKLQEETMRNFMRYSTNTFSKQMAEAANISLGTVLNYLMKGKKKDNEALGLKTEDVIVEFLCDRLGMMTSKIYQFKTGYNDISVRLEDDMIKLRVLDWGIELPMFENIPAFLNMIMEFCFGWMEMAWKYSFPEPGTVPDLRDMKEDASELIERQKELYDNLKPVEYRYYGK